jgi:hypothetical protein
MDSAGRQVETMGTMETMDGATTCACPVRIVTRWCAAQSRLRDRMAAGASNDN